MSEKILEESQQVLFEKESSVQPKYDESGIIDSCYNGYDADGDYQCIEESIIEMKKLLEQQPCSVASYEFCQVIRESVEFSNE